MAIFSDYVGSYSDLKNAFNGAEMAGGLYVDSQPDLAQYWNANKDDPEFRKKYPLKSDYGKYHYNNFGKAEGREMYYHTEVNDPSIGTVYWERYVENNPEVQKAWQDAGSPADRKAFGENYWNNTGKAKGHKAPTRVLGAEGWGQAHWATYGSNEDRILPGIKLSVDSNGTVYVANPDLIGSEARKYYDGLVNSVNNAPKGTYKYLMEGLQKALGDNKFNDLVNNQGLDVITAGYQKTKVSPWDAKSLGAQPPTGGFDADYYGYYTPGGQTALDQWNDAQSSVNVSGIYLPDIDVVGQYTKNSYLHWYYTTQGKAAGDRGNAAEYAGLTEGYEEFLTDADYQFYRDQVLGLSDRFDTLKEWADAQDENVLKQWYDSLPSDQKKQYNEGTLAVPTFDTIPDSLRGKLVMDKGTTILEGNLSPILGDKEKEQQKIFASLTRDSLKQAASELQKVKLREQQFDFYKGLEGFNEIASMNESLANSILGDSGLGGILGFMGDSDKTKESLENSLAQATGIKSRNSAIYNWQNWFEKELTKRYEGGLEVTDPLDPNVTYTIDADFAKDYIERYLKPRFDTSRSMTEFVSYMDVKQNEQNVFQTQSALDSLRDIADLRSKAYLDNIKSQSPLNFSSEFYWNPGGNFSADDPKAAVYAKQKEEVANDWEIAKNQGNTEKVPGTDWTWNQWAYHYGLDINNAEQFAKLHYQVKGAAEGFDPAKDVITLKDAEDYIQQKILPEIVDEKLNLGDISFLNFVTPEEFADQLLKGISPEQQKEEWDKLLETLGLGGKSMGVEEVKQYIIDAFRTGAAKQIRESIKYLNEKKQKPTQEKLGVEYIERPEDYKPTTSPNETTLYKIFKQAGYQGNEDDFYETFMTDIDRGEMELLTQGQKGLSLGGAYAGLTSKDPFQALGSIESLFDTTEPYKKEEAAPSYFKLFGDDDSDSDYKSKSGKKILGEFTSFFTGFS